jgi:prepilin-type N-terminal cleavage/methylation domain-containing protein
MDSSARPVQPRPARAFSLIELLLVIGIIVILVAIAIGVGFRVTGSGKARNTEQILRVMDQALTEYIAKAGSNPKPYVLDPRAGNPTNNPWVFPIVDGQDGAGATEINSVGLFILQCKDYPTAHDAFASLPPGALKDWNPGAVSTSPGSGQPTLTTVFDGWGKAIRYVHPAFGGTTAGGIAQDVYNASGNGILKAPPSINGVQGRFVFAQVTRSWDASGTGNSDGGIPPGNRGYFYSCGPDGLPQTIEDNVYTTVPRQNQ